MKKYTLILSIFISSVALSHPTTYCSKRHQELKSLLNAELDENTALDLRVELDNLKKMCQEIDVSKDLLAVDQKLSDLGITPAQGESHLKVAGRWLGGAGSLYGIYYTAFAKKAVSIGPVLHNGGIRFARWAATTGNLIVSTKKLPVASHPSVVTGVITFTTSAALLVMCFIL